MSPLRNRIIQIWQAAIGPWVNEEPYLGQILPPNANSQWKFIYRALSKELGWEDMRYRFGNECKQCEGMFREASDGDALRIVELVFRYIDTAVRNLSEAERQSQGSALPPDEAIEELNDHLLKAGVGVQFTKGQLLNMESPFMCETTTKPVLTLLEGDEFCGACDEFIRAYSHFREGRHKEAIVEACKAFESVLITICEQRGWECPERPSAKDLIKTVFDHGLLPIHLRSEFDALRSTLESGLPSLRNKKTAHGQGSEIVEVPSYLVAYALHLAAANILLVISAHRANNPTAVVET